MKFALIASMLLSFTTIAQGIDPSRRESDLWYGFGPGSWVEFQLTEQTGNEVKQRFQERYSIVKIKFGRPMVTRVQSVDGSFKSKRPALVARFDGVDPEGIELQLRPYDRFDETLQIDGRSVACKVTRYRRQLLTGGQEMTLSLWRAIDFKVPYRELPADGPDIALSPDVMKVEYRIAKDGNVFTCRLGVSKFVDKIEIGDRTVSCVHERGTVSRVVAGEPIVIEISRWISNQVPGRLVRFNSIARKPGGDLIRTKQATAFSSVGLDSR